MVGCGIVNFFRAAEADIRNTGPGLAQTVCQCVAQKRSGKAGVAPQHNVVCGQHFRHGPPKGMGEASTGNLTNTIEVTFSTRSLLRWGDLTVRFQPLAHQGIQPVTYALDRALAYRASRETRAMLRKRDIGGIFRV